MTRKRSNLSTYTRASKRMRMTSSEESNEERQERLRASRERMSLHRASETPVERDSRLSADSERHRLSRVSETYTQTEYRLSADRERHRLSRASETFTEREVRLTADRERHTISRASETFTEQELRLTADRERHSVSRASETFTERELRLTADRERHTVSRASETFTERELRLTADRERHTISRTSESFSERESRLTSDRDRHELSRASETFTQYVDRLSNDRERHSIARALESDDQHQRRLEVARENYERLRETHNTSLEMERERVDALRRAETEEQREDRLHADRLRHALSRMSVSSEDSDDPEETVMGHEILSWINKEKSAFVYTHMIDCASFSSIGGMVVQCQFCDAMKWPKETSGMCCSNGKVHISIFNNIPEILKALLDGDHPQSHHFLENIRQYNSTFQMTSFGANQVTEGYFMPTFKIQGQVYHLIGSLLPENQPKFLQIYFVSDYQEQANIRNQNFPQLNGNLIRILKNMLHEVNPYIQSFKTSLESFPPQQNNEYKFVIYADKRPAAEHRGRYNAPVANEVAVVLLDQECERRDIVLRTRDDRLQRICETHRAYDTLQYPLIFCRGEDGYHFGLNQINPITRQPNLNKTVSAQQFYAYLLQIRRNNFIYLQRFRGLFNQFIVDMYAKIETERLVYIRTNQRRLRAEEYVHLRDALQQDADSENLGRLVILPSSFTGGPRYMHERTQDAFCYVRKYGQQDLFITFTTNPN